MKRKRSQAIFAGLACAMALSAPVAIVPSIALAVEPSPMETQVPTPAETEGKSSETATKNSAISDNNSTAEVQESLKAPLAPDTYGNVDIASTSDRSADDQANKPATTAVKPPDAQAAERIGDTDCTPSSQNQQSQIEAAPKTSKDAQASLDGTEETSTKTTASSEEADDTEQQIDDGVYSISTGLSSGRYVDVPSASDSNSVQLQLYDGNNTLAQYYRIVHSSEKGYYTLQNVKSGKMLDVRSAGKTNGTAVQQYSQNGTAAQLWHIVRDGLYFWLSPKNAPEMRLDVSNANEGNGAVLQLYENNGTKAQRFSLMLNSYLTSALEQGTSLEEDYYRIASSVDSNIVLDIANGSTASGANLQAYSSNGTKAQKFLLKKQASGLYTIEDAGTSKVLDVENGSRQSGANVRQWNSNGTLAQLWYLVSSDNAGTYVIHSANSDMVLDLTSAQAANGTNVQQWTANGTNAQRWILSETPVVNDDTYVIQSAVAEPMVLDISGGSNANGANVQIYESNGTDAQRFFVHYLGHGLYSIRNIASGKYLDVAGASSASGANVQQYEWNGTAAQQWRIRLGLSGYSFQARCSNDYLDVSGASQADGANVQQWTGNESAAQLWNLRDSSWIYPRYGQAVSAMNSGQSRLRDSAYSTSATPAGYCALWVTNVYNRAGYGYHGGNANDMYWNYCHSSNLMDLKVGMIVAVSSHSHSSAGSVWGHVGIYVGDGIIRDSVYGYVRTISVRDWINYYSTTVTPRWGWLGEVRLA